MRVWLLLRRDNWRKLLFISGSLSTHPGSIFLNSVTHLPPHNKTPLINWTRSGRTSPQRWGQGDRNRDKHGEKLEMKSDFSGEWRARKDHANGHARHRTPVTMAHNRNVLASSKPHKRGRLGAFRVYPGDFSSSQANDRNYSGRGVVRSVGLSPGFLITEWEGLWWFLQGTPRNGEIAVKKGI